MVEPNQIANFETLKNKFNHYTNLNYSFFRFVLLNNPKDNNWYVLFAQVILSKNKFDESYKEIYKKDRVYIVEYAGDRSLVYYFLSNIQGSVPFLLYNFEPQIYAYTPFTVCSESLFIGSNDDENIFGFPYEKLALIANHSVEYEINNILAEYPSLDLLILDKLKINLRRNLNLKNRITFYFDIGLGKIKEAIVENETLGIKLEFNQKELGKYVLKAFIDNYGETEIVQSLPIQNEINYGIGFIPQRAELFLIYEDKKADKVIAKIKPYLKQKNIGASDYQDETNELKKQIVFFKNEAKNFKTKIDMKDLQIGELSEKRLVEAEKKTEPNDILQALSEAMEYVCKDYCSLFDLKTNKVGLQMHDKIVQHWIENSGKNWTHLLYQTGVRHIIRLGSLKEHTGYDSFNAEIEYLKLLSWRGYFELLRMMNEVHYNNKKRRNFDNLIMGV